MKLITVNSNSDINRVATLANVIWREYYPAIISAGQVDYMLQKFQSPPAIMAQLAEGYQYFFIAEGAQKLGYMSIFQDKLGKSLQLSKLYILAQARKKGLGRFAQQQLDHLANQQGITQIWLTVNKHNYGAIVAYQKMGFEIAKPVVNDIGQGYVMDDYEMRRKIS